MVWDREKKNYVPPSAIRQLLPLIITLFVLGVVGWVCYQIWVSMLKIKAQARKQMGDNVVITKGGVRLRVQNVEAESYVDATQSWVVKAWNLASSGSNASADDGAAKRKRHVLAKQRPGSEDD